MIRSLIALLVLGSAVSCGSSEGPLAGAPDTESRPDIVGLVDTAPPRDTESQGDTMPAPDTAPAPDIASLRDTMPARDTAPAPAPDIASLGDTMPATDADPVNDVPPDATTEPPLAERGVHTLDLADGRRLEITLLSPQVVRLRYMSGPVPHPERGWTHPPYEPPAEDLPLEEEDGVHTFRTSALELRVSANDGQALIRDASGTVLSDDLPHEPSRPLAVRKRITASERFYGFGSKTGPLDKRGRRMEMWTTDPLHPDFRFDADSDPLYQSHPFYISLRGGAAHGVYVINTHRSVFDVGASTTDILDVEVEGGELDYVLFAGPSMAKVVERFTAFVGRAPRPPLWTLGYHQCRWSYAPESEVRRIEAGFRERVEKQDDCSERSNREREAYGDLDGRWRVLDEVAAWRSAGCP